MLDELNNEDYTENNDYLEYGKMKVYKNNKISYNNEIFDAYGNYNFWENLSGEEKNKLNILEQLRFMINYIHIIKKVEKDGYLQKENILYHARSNEHIFLDLIYKVKEIGEINYCFTEDEKEREEIEKIYKGDTTNDRKSEYRKFLKSASPKI
jgi:hypothetical protein